MKNPELNAFVKERVNIMLESSHTYKDLKACCQAWLDAEGTDKEPEALKALLAEAEADVMDLDHVIQIVTSEGGKRYFGEAVAKAYHEEAVRRKNNGERWCFCEACVAARELTEKKAEILA